MPQITDPTVRPATLDDQAAARTLFKAYPYKIVQQIVQRLDRTRLVDLYTANLKAALEAGTPHWLVEERGDPLALAGLADDHWHAEIYGIKMGKLTPWLNTRRVVSGQALLSTVERHARDNQFQHLSVRLDGEDFDNLHLFEAAGWRLMDVSLKFSLPMPIVRSEAAPASVSGWQVGLALMEDATWIRRIGSATHTSTHYMNDPSLPEEKTRDLFSRWLGRCIERLAYRIYTLRDTQEQGRGFVTYLRSPGFAERAGRSPVILDFVLLDPDARGGGLGPWFVEETLARESESGFDYCELRTSAHNLPAVQAYEKLGFRCCASDFVLHKNLQ